MHVNLILDEEKRSASPVSIALIAKLAGIVFLVLVAIWGVTFYMSYRSLQNDVRFSKDEWARTELKYKEALRLRTELNTREATLNEIEGWRASRIAWGDQLKMLQAAVPAVIQLTDVRIDEVIPVSGVRTGRVYEATLSGRTPAERSEVNVSQLLDALKSPPFDRFVESSSLPSGSFRQDPTDRSFRTFNIVSLFLPRPLP